MPKPIHREKFPVARAVANIRADRGLVTYWENGREYMVFGQPQLGKSIYQEGFDSNTVYLDELSHFMSEDLWGIPSRFLEKHWYDR